MKEKKISVVHLYYIIVIGIIVNSFFLVIAFGGSENASTMMSTAATVSSLILSVIAIVMTLVDVAGQRESIINIKETADKLEINLKTVEDSVEEINNLKENLLNSMNLIQESNNSIMGEIVELKEKYSINEKDNGKNINPENFVKDLEKLSKIIYTTRISKGNYDYYYKIINNNKEVSKKILEYLKHNFENGRRYEFNELWSKAEVLNITRARFKRELETLTHYGKIERDGFYYILKL